ncbi:LysR family transcriptional regulator [Erwinia sp. JUb26]|uniref:LysR family transcriptional regulator n=1 Tax=Erwinia sp. JUb26 TaxID=2485126 RepID=UPI000F4AEB90|nr:LysR family transcriptional regulator [Erwinia sp. JUb26]ROR15166.1 DNA-binding transcriptional LysR family regulator [Erwinia sp. JUb26]
MRSNLDFTSLRIFVAVIEQGSFVGASKALNVPTSNVSRSVTQLEERLNIQLIERTTRHSKLTPSGQLLYTRVKPLLASLEQTEAELTSGQVQLKGPLRLCIPNEIGPILFGTPLAQFACRYPDIELSCTTNLSGLESLKEDLDLAIIITRGQMADCDYVARHLLDIPCAVVASPDLISRCGMPTDIRQLEHLPCITTVNALNGAAWQFVNRKGGFDTVSVNGRYRVNSGEMAGRAAVAGVGFAILSTQACHQEIAAGRLIEVNFDRPAAPLQLYALYSNRRYLPVRTRTLIEFIQQGLSFPAQPRSL